MVDFGVFDTAFTRYQEKGLADFRPGMDFEAFYRRVRMNLEAQGSEAYYRYSFGFEIERRWFAVNCPEFKVYPAMVEAMQRTSVDIDGRYFKMPYPTFQVRIPKRMIRDEDGPYLDSILVTGIEEPLATAHINMGNASVALVNNRDPIVRKLVIFLCFDTASIQDAGRFNYFKFPVLDGRTIERTFNETTMRSDGKPIRDTAGPDFARVGNASKFNEPDGYWPTRALYRRILPIVMGTAFFGIGRDRQTRVVQQERLPRRERRRIAKETGQKTRNVVGERPVFTVGADLVLPRYEPDPNRERSEIAPETPCARVGCAHRYDEHTSARRGCSGEECGCVAYDTGKHLSHGYVRCGHLHWYCVGPKRPGPGERNDYELRWVDPTVVRPDLPIAPVRPRAIRTPRNAIVSADLSRLDGAPNG